MLEKLYNDLGFTFVQRSGRKFYMVIVLFFTTPPPPPPLGYGVAPDIADIWQTARPLL